MEPTCPHLFPLKPVQLQRCRTCYEKWKVCCSVFTLSDCRLIRQISRWRQEMSTLLEKQISINNACGLISFFFLLWPYNVQKLYKWVNNIQTRCERDLSGTGSYWGAPLSEWAYVHFEIRLWNEDQRDIISLFLNPSLTSRILHTKWSPDFSRKQRSQTCIHSLTVSSEGVQPFSW